MPFKSEKQRRWMHANKPKMAKKWEKKKENVEEKKERDYKDIPKEFSYIKLNLEDKNNIDEIKKSIKKLDILINNGGLSFPDGKSEDDPDIFDRAVYIHLNSFYRLSNLLKVYFVL